MITMQFMVKQFIIGFLVIAIVLPLWVSFHEMGHAYLYRKLGCTDIYWELWPPFCYATIHIEGLSYEEAVLKVRSIQGIHGRYEQIDDLFWTAFISIFSSIMAWRITGKLEGSCPVVSL